MRWLRTHLKPSTRVTKVKYFVHPNSYAARTPWETHNFFTHALTSQSARKCTLRVLVSRSGMYQVYMNAQAESEHGSPKPALRKGVQRYLVISYLSFAGGFIPLPNATFPFAYCQRTLYVPILKKSCLGCYCLRLSTHWAPLHARSQEFTLCRDSVHSPSCMGDSHFGAKRTDKACRWHTLIREKELKPNCAYETSNRIATFCKNETFLVYFKYVFGNLWLYKCEWMGVRGCS